jgi:hypothetical protein
MILEQPSGFDQDVREVGESSGSEERLGFGEERSHGKSEGLQSFRLQRGEVADSVAQREAKRSQLLGAFAERVGFGDIEAALTPLPEMVYEMLRPDSGEPLRQDGRRI